MRETDAVKKKIIEVKEKSSTPQKRGASLDSLAGQCELEEVFSGDVFLGIKAEISKLA